MTESTGLLSPVRAGTPVEAAVDDVAWVQAMLDAESALARAQARLGTLPPEAAEMITRCARVEAFDVRAIALASRETANPVVALVQALTAGVAAKDRAAAEYVHRGSTSQDIFDTGAMLVARRAIALIRADLTAVATSLGVLAGRHRDTVMAGRTLALHAVPTTFGLKAAGWRRLVLDARDRLDALVLPVALGGAAGTLAGYQEYANMDGHHGEGYPARLTAAYAEETGLAAVVLPWHALRTPMADLAAALAHTAGALGKFAADVLVLVRTEIGEVAEPTVAGRGSSSAMPHKSNPVLSTLIRSAALQAPCYAAALTQCLVAEDERSAGVWHAEWLPLRELLRLVGGAAHTAEQLAAGLTVRPERMRANLALTGNRVATERVAAVLTPHLGRAPARALLTEASRVAEQTGQPLHQVLGADSRVAGHLSEQELTRLLDPAGYVGAAGDLVDRELRD
ncbi:adenylosuccinate lyase family protein [Micromonospora sp. NPDC047134]|uniref:class-II fumarase/aspartase family protein n=1 Tax=Micromonospora sp. NPDC047134 TaxID=3154340 RepID=UPI0033CA2D36